MRMLAVLVTGLTLLTLTGPHAVLASPERALYTELVGTEENPPNESTARGTLTAALNSDNTITYSLNATGFETNFRFAHFHTAPRGTNGPIIIFLDCNEKGTACSGTTRALTESELDLLDSRGIYVNMHTDAIPSGEIRGQVASVDVAPPAGTASVTNFSGKASGFGQQKGEVRIKGKFVTSAPVDLRQSTSLSISILDEVGGEGELLRSTIGEAIFSVPLHQAKPDNRGKEAVYTTVSAGHDPACKLKLKNKGKGLFEFTFDCKRDASVQLPFGPSLCAGEKRQTTNLRTWLVFNVGTPVAFNVTLPWICKGRDGFVKELKAVELKNGQVGTPPVPPPPPPDDNVTPRADFRMDEDRGPAPLTVTFENRSSDEDDDPLTYAWDFGDGATSTERDPVHTFEQPGKYKVALTVQDSKGATSEPAEQDVDVREP